MASGQIKINGLDALINGLTELQQNQAPYALMLSLNNIGFQARKDVIEEMKTVFVNPTPYTLGAFTVVKATKADLSVRVWFKDPERLSESQHYLYPNVKGVKRGYKPYEGRLNAKGLLPSGWYTVPASGATFDSYGNMSRGQITQILSYFETFNEGGYKANTTDAQKEKFKKSTIKKYGFEYFLIKPGSTGKLPPGIWKRVFSNFGDAIVPVLLYYQQNKFTYERKLEVDLIGKQTFNRMFKDEFTTNLDRALATAFR